MRGVNIRLIKARLFKIRGKAVDSRTGGPASGQLSLRPKGGMAGPGSQFNAVVEPATGTFEFHAVGAGTYVMQADPGGRRGATVPGLTGRMEVNVTDSDVDGLVFTLSPPLEITGTVRVEGGDLQSLWRPVFVGGAGGHLVVLANFEDSNPGPSGQVDSNGIFKIQDVGWSRYTINLISLQSGSYVKSMRFGGQDVLKSPLDLTSGVGGVLDILLSPKAAEVDATVRGKDGVAVTIWPKTAVSVDPLSGSVFTTGLDGNVKLTSIPPGEYYVAAWEDVDRSLLGYPDFLARFTDQATLIKVGESDKVSMDLTPIPKDKIAAEVAKLP